MIKLSGVVITYNEEANIAPCIDSLMKVADEIIVVDSYSTDKTKDIAISKGARFILHAFNSYEEQKNFATAQANNLFILSLDADEQLSEELVNSILDLKRNPVYDGYSMNRLNNYCGQWIKHSGWYPDKKLRLWNKEKGEWKGKIHERVEMNKGAITGFIKGDILHYTIKTIAQHNKQIDKFSSAAANILFEQGKTSTTFFAFLSSAVTFIKTYFLRLGFLDGYYGWVISIKGGKYNYLKYSKLADLNRLKK